LEAFQVLRNVASLEQRPLSDDWLTNTRRFPDLWKALVARKLDELLNCCRAVTLIVVVGVSVDRDASFPDVVTEIDPTAQLFRAVYNNLVPNLGDGLDLFAITKPPNVGPVGCHRIEFQFRRIRHPRAILKHLGDLVISQEVRKFTVKPVCVPQFYRELVVRWELLQERYHAIQKFVTISENAATEEWKLKNDRAELCPENTYRVQELLQFWLTVNEDLIVRDRLRGLDRENKVVRCFRKPATDGIDGRASIERRVDFDRIEMFGVETQIVPRMHASGVERSAPAGGRKRRGAKMNRSCHDKEYS